MPDAIGAQFDRFLYAPVYEGGEDMPLSVVSALARLGVDPWEQAAALTRLSRAAATQQLALMLAALPAWPVASDVRDASAARLIALLPGARTSNPRAAPVSTWRQPKGARSGRLWLYALLLLALVGVLLTSRACVEVGHEGPLVSGGAEQRAPPAPSSPR